MLIVVDPTAETQPALERGQSVAREWGLNVELFICDYSPQLVGSKLLNAERREQAKRGFLADQKARLDELAAPLRDAGLDVTVSAAWDHPLYDGIVRQVLHSNPRVVVKDTHYHSRLERALFTNTDWHLIRTCPVPLWLVKQERNFESPVILAAVDPLHDNDKPANLDSRLLSEAFELADETGGIVHVFHGYNPFIDPDDPKQVETAHEQAMEALAEQFQLPADRVHVRPGNAVDLLPAIANEISADLVVMGAVSRARLEYAIVGSTAENVLDQLPCDVLIVKPKGYVSPVTFKSAPRGVIYAEDAEGA
ncbi:MAG: universal stress protein, partial [Gammaproteobacteria bacterium]